MAKAQRNIDNRTLYEIIGFPNFVSSEDIIEHFAECVDIFYSKERGTEIDREGWASINQYVWDGDITELERQLYYSPEVSEKKFINQSGQSESMR